MPKDETKKVIEKIFDYTLEDIMGERFGSYSKYIIIPICPEQQGGLPTPRIPSELLNKAEDIEQGKGKIVSKEGYDVTANFIKGAEEIVRIARLYGVQQAVLKSKSPSCGIKSVYDGTFSSVLIDGQGYTAHLLNRD